MYIQDMAILKLLLHQKEVRSRLVRLVQTIYSESCGNEVNFECMPDNADIVDLRNSSTSWGGGSGRVDPMTLFGTIHNRKVADSKVTAKRTLTFF
jgi:hypothetical protein